MKYRTTFNIAWQHEKINDFVFIRNYQTQDFLDLEDVAKDFWLAIVNNESFGTLYEKLSAQYSGMTRNEVYEDYRAFLADCLEQGLIEVDDENG